MMLSVNAVDTTSGKDVSWGPKQLAKQKVASSKPLLTFNKEKDKFEDLLPKFYRVDFGFIKRKNYVYDYTKKFADIDGKIGPTKQVKGDCWLLSGVNALANTAPGRKYIKKSIAYHDDKITVVHFAGTNVSITIPQIALSAAKQSKTYVKGDDDMLAIELAAEYYKKILLDNNASVKNVGPNVVTGKYTTGNVKAPLLGGYPSDIMYLLTGKRAKTVFNGKYSCPKSIKNAIVQKQKSPDKAALACNFRKPKDGVIIHHAYAIKKVDDKYVTLINPHDSGKETKVTLESFYSNVKSLTMLDL